MNRNEHILRRLLKAARQPEQEAPKPMPFPLQSRILAGWRSNAPAEELSFLAGLFRRAVACALLAAIASIGWNQISNAREVPGALALSNLVENIQLIP